ncbi:DIS3-like exonuclease 1 [Lineus longissimus]|uniref:DIS3-like exonuclease 1 n=1 Tax=Lineus longissimus TaxID=88925 RepID=UPI002B4EBD5A
MIKTEKLLRIKNQSGHSVKIVREHYLREDVPCQSPLCLAGCKSSGTCVRLPCNVTHYLIPDGTVAKDFLEMLEFPEISGIIFMQTVASYVSFEGGRRLQNRLSNLIKDCRKQCITFHNEFQRYCYCPRLPGENYKKWVSRSTYEAAQWFYNHLAAQIPIVMVSEDPEVVTEYLSKTAGVFVLGLEGYMTMFWPDLKASHDLYESLAASIQESRQKLKDYSGYQPADVLESGIKSGHLFKGILRVDKYNAQQEAFMQSLGSDAKLGGYSSDILISGQACRNRSVHGDVVVVELLPKAEWKGRSNALKDIVEESQDDVDALKSNTMPSGRVVGVLQRNWRDYVASFVEEKESEKSTRRGGKVLVLPWDYRIPKIRISTRQAESLKDHRILVRIDSWEVDSQYPNGHFVKSLGPIGDLETEISCLLIEKEIAVRPFSEGQLKELPVNTEEKPWIMEQEEIGRRRDLRQSHLVFSIDPKGCEDVDDTLSVRKLPNGHTELGVHIADVTYFVKPNSLTDLEAQSRSTTVYLADRRYDMLPPILSADLCSLVSGVDRYAVSVIWDLDENYEVVDVWYGRTVIRSKYKLFYEIAQAMHDGAIDKELVENILELQSCGEVEVCQRLYELRQAVNMLMKIARNFKARRVSGGGIELEGVEVQVQLDDSKNIEDLVPKKPLEIHETIAECMIYANHWVARKISEAYPTQALLRHHPPPRQEQFTALVNCAKSKGFTIDTSSNKALAESLDRSDVPGDPVINKLLRSLATQAMSNALYFSTGSLQRDHFFHYGLALDRYTHFTSPIRRYADIIVHRLLLSAVGEQESVLPSNMELDSLSQHINTKHRASQHAQKSSQELFQALFFKNRDPDDECLKVEGVVYQIKANGMIVFIPRYGMKGPVYLKDKSGQVVYLTRDGTIERTGGNLVREEDRIAVNCSFGSQTYRLFDHVVVRIVLRDSHAHACSVSLELVSNRCGPKGSKGKESTAIKTDIVKEVTQSIDVKYSQEQDLDLGENFNQLKTLYGQSDETKSLYTLVESLKEAALAPT